MGGGTTLPPVRTDPAPPATDRRAEEPVPPLGARLRAETADAHARVEAAVDLPSLVRSAAAYARFLAGLHAVYAPLEQRLDAFPEWTAVGLSLAPRRKTPLLVSDLAALRAPGTARWIGDVSMPASFGQALGCLYVLEGSTLGGRTIARHLRASPHRLPTRFVEGYGARTGVMWRAFQDALRRHERRGGDGDDVVRGAAGTFGALERSLAGRAPRA